MALAVLALWLLTLLAPLHQTAGLMRQMAAVGVDTGAAWVFCQSLVDAPGDTGDHALPLCPVQGIGKNDLALPPPLALAARVLTVPGETSLQLLALAPPALIEMRSGQPRAPPALI